MLLMTMPENTSMVTKALQKFFDVNAHSVMHPFVLWNADKVVIKGTLLKKSIIAMRKRMQQLYDLLTEI